MTQYTDADVARMLGWKSDRWCAGVYIDEVGWHHPASFGLSTPHGPKADANTARFVLPFIEAQGWYFRYEIDCGDHVVTITDGETPELGYDLGDCFASTVCRAALQAWEEKKGNQP